jgi:predicted RNA-binding Zn-ribbon protein involved in translation (DUF1610 family)
MPIKAKLTLSVDKKILNEAKKAAEQKHVPLSRVVENFLDFFSNPRVYCFKCGDRFDSSVAGLCPKCGWLICPKCKTCRCGLNEEIATSVFYMRRVYEDLLSGRVK